jgi:AAA+ superfamily predicted ATPase
MATTEPWETLADALLHRDALLCLAGRGAPPSEFAGLYVGQDEVRRVLATLPGLDGAAPEAAEPLRGQVEPLLRASRDAFARFLDGASVFARLARAGRLTGQEAEVLALVAAVELHPQRQRLVAYLQDSVHLPRLTLATVRRLLGGGPARVRALAPGARLCRAELVEVDANGPWAVRMTALPARVAWALSGDDSPDPELPVGCARLAAAGADQPAPELLLVTGGDRAGRLAAVVERWPDHGRLVGPLPASPAAWRAVVREATVAGLVVVLEVEDRFGRDGCHWVERADHLTWVLSSARELPLEALPDRPWNELRAADATATAADWALAMPGCRPAGLEGHRLTREQLGLVAAAWRGGSGQLDQAVRRLAGGHLDGLATRVRPERRWDDLVLPADQAEQLRELVARYRQRATVYERWGFRALPSAGVVALFAGPSGTGKTLAAEVIAGELGLDLYKVDLSSVVSKYIGETEKNLERVFVAAAAGNLVLFFDEADALFGKRSEVADAHDRYANIEVAYLLQRLESYDGLVVLATNLQRNIDQAFLRRLSVAVEFPLPDEPQRHAIWARSFPPWAPAADLDVDFLARQFKLPGGAIRNAALTAAFLAAEAGGEITMERVVIGLKREFQKLGRLRTEAEFERYFDVVRRESHAAAR